MVSIMPGEQSLAVVDFGGITRDVQLQFVPETRPGDFVLVHVGFAIARIDAEAAARTSALLAEMAGLEDTLAGEDP
ncbi:MAG TPA: HypC/HybG/HupF family hydrogenase formation chaperone [Terriglobales bacterium]|nr:HypC/HybG/HupF family hydrogenase formation chaperone [Terriglobales bacterium]